MNVLRTVGAAAAAALCGLGLVVAAGAATALPNLAQVLGERGQAMAAHYGATSEPGPVAIPHGADRQDVSVVAPDPAIVSGERWAAEAHRIAQSTPSPSGGIDGVSFDWQDAGAGALAALALVALIGVGAYGLHSRTARRPVSGAAS